MELKQLECKLTLLVKLHQLAINLEVPQLKPVELSPLPLVVEVWEVEEEVEDHHANAK